jgi:hypothetical protein
LAAAANVSVPATKRLEAREEEVSRSARFHDNLRLCYQALVKLDLIGKGELSLLEAWLGDLDAIAPQ